MDVDRQTAAALGFPKQEYFQTELERRWICGEAPKLPIRQVEEITDIYVSGSRLRLRKARPLNGGPLLLRLSRKADVNAYTRLMTSIYLPENEFVILDAALSGVRIRKLRHRLESPPGVRLLFDLFQDQLEGLILAEAEFDTADELLAFSMPAFALREVTDDARYGGASLAANGLPKE